MQFTIIGLKIERYAYYFLANAFYLVVNGI